MANEQDVCVDDGRHEMMGVWCGQHFRAKHQCVIERLSARIAELEHEVSVYLKRIDEAQARMSNLESDKTEMEQVIAAIRTLCGDIYRNPNSSYARGVADLKDQINGIINAGLVPAPRR